MNTIKMLHIVANLNPKFGGPSSTVNKIAFYTSKSEGISVQVLSQSLGNEESSTSQGDSLSFLNPRTNSIIGDALGLTVRNFLNQIQCKDFPDIVYGHGVWHPVNYWTYLFCKSNKIPLIIHTHGMLEPWSLSHNSFKKKIANLFYQQRILRFADLLIASSSSDLNNLRSLGYSQPIAVIPHGVDTVDGKSDFTSKLVTNKAKKRILFLSRFHQKKGVLELVEAWSRIDRGGWELVLAGPDDRGFRSIVEARVSSMGLNSSVIFMGPVNGEDKESLYKSADLFVLPTFSENFGMVILEALSFGIPVITTHGAPWSDLEEFGGGWWIPVGVPPLISALDNAMKLSDAERKLIGTKALEISKRYSWEESARKTNSVYNWLVKNGKPPYFIDLT